MADSLEHILACQICLEDFEETGDRVPRIMPCSHTLCEKCLKQLIKPSNGGDFVECPECRMKHRVVNDVKTFPQNKYILTNIKRKPEDSGKETAQKEVTKCEEHGRQLILFCKRSECQKAICLTCLTKYHREHDVVDIVEEEKEALAAEVEAILQNLKEKKQAVSVVQTTIDHLHDSCVQKLRENEEICLRLVKERFEEMIESVDEQRLRTKDIGESISCLDQHQELLNNIKENITNSDVDAETRDNIASNLEVVHSIKESIEFNLSRDKSYEIFECQPDHEKMKHHVEILCDQLVKREIRLYEIIAATKTKASDFSFTVTASFYTSNDGGYSMALVDDEKAVILLGSNSSVTKVTKYNIATGQELSSAKVNLDAREITEVMLSGKRCIAISYWSPGRNIEFRDLDNLSRIVEVLPLHPEKPYALCSNKHLLYYADWSDCQVKELNCLTSPPKHVNQNRIKVGGFVTDMCIADKTLIAVSESTVKIYNLGEYDVPDVLPDVTKQISSISVASTGRGHFFVCDNTNDCVHMFNLNADDKYMGVLLKAGDLGLGKKHKIRWCEKTSSLLFAHIIKGRNFISAVKVQ